ncbi:tyrosine-type recombinase/integrase [Photobacterium carnosum]|uniref:tyrosine-type recombinase/integrase n=1 Tax=Photobacterium carnosum TaxID=2023717 RepID=UPI001E5B8523|nr:tyrosine-type recombinase/integrase [Photobacterium carnosum]MCD9494094.1 tyrosine-type recombinase/integrase [Photobacterium carnosum]
MTIIPSNSLVHNDFNLRPGSLRQQTAVSQQIRQRDNFVINPALAYINSLAATDTTGGQANARYTLERFSRFLLTPTFEKIDWIVLLTTPSLIEKAMAAFLIHRAKTKAKMKGLFFDPQRSLKNLHVNPLKKALLIISDYFYQQQQISLSQYTNWKYSIEQFSLYNQSTTALEQGWLPPSYTEQILTIELTSQAKIMLEAFSCFCIKPCIERMDWYSVLYAPVLQTSMQSFLSSRLTMKSSDRKQDYAPATADNLLRMLRGVAHHAWLSESISIETLQRIKAIKLPRGSRQSSGRYLSYTDVDQISALTLAQSNKIKALRDNAIFWLMYESGLRRAEVIGLDVNDIDLYLCKIRVLGKGNKERYVPFSKSSDLYAAIEQWIMVRSQHPQQISSFFCGVNRYQQLTSQRLTTQTLNDLCKHIYQLGFSRRISPHDFRHSVATNLLRSGYDLLLVSKFMGHSSITTTQRYDRRTDDELQGVTPGR